MMRQSIGELANRISSAHYHLPMLSSYNNLQVGKLLTIKNFQLINKKENKLRLAGTNLCDDKSGRTTRIACTLSPALAH